MSEQILLQNKVVKLDTNQSRAISLLNNIHNSYQENRKSSIFSKIYSFFSKNKANKTQGLYLYGQVGRGKSMLMRHFFDKFPTKNKLYLHFNTFMQKVHRQLHDVRNKSNADKEQLIEIVTKNIVQDTVLLCLDEFQVEEVTDALILRRIFSYIFQQNIIVIFTSNSKPKNLYQNGLQRDLFLKFINNILLKNCQIFNLDGKTDYRQQFLSNSNQSYFYPINQKNTKDFHNIIDSVSEGKKFTTKKISFLGRDLLIQKSLDNIAIFDFSELFQENLGVIDYQEICQRYNVIFLLNLPILNPEDRNEAKRFILFIDEIYENKVRLFILAQAEIDDIYKKGQNSWKFQRTASRIKEITYK